jgi:hypothetical protein
MKNLEILKKKILQFQKLSIFSLFCQNTAQTEISAALFARTNDLPSCSLPFRTVLTNFEKASETVSERQTVCRSDVMHGKWLKIFDLKRSKG